MKKCLLFALIIVLILGCLTPAQRAEIDAIRRDMVSASNTIAELLPVKEKLDQALENLIQAFKEKRIPLAEFEALSKIYREEKAVVLEKIEELKAAYKDAETRIKKIESEGVPWYEIVGGLLLNIILAGLGADQFFKKRSEQTQKNAVIVGLEEALKGTPQPKAQPILDAITLEAKLNGVTDALAKSVKALTGDSERPKTETARK